MTKRETDVEWMYAVAAPKNAKERARARQRARNQRLLEARIANGEPTLFFVYALSDRSGIRYVGHCGALASRYCQHLDPNRNSKRMRAWLASIAPACPGLSVLHVADSKARVVELEQMEIARLVGEGRNLVNVADRPDSVAREPAAAVGTLHFKVKRPWHARGGHERAMAVETEAREQWKKRQAAEPKAS